MKKLILVTLFLSWYLNTTNAQNISEPYKIFVINTYEGIVYQGFCENTKVDPVQLFEFNLGTINIPEKHIRGIEIFECNSLVKIKLSDNRTINGKIQNISLDSVTISHVYIGRISIPLNNISSIKAGRIELEGKWSADPNCTRYFFAPSSFMLRKGEGYYQNAYILSNSVNYGLSDHFTIGGGVILPILFYVTPKLGYSLNDYLHLSAGIFAGGTYLNSGIGAGIGYGLITIGTQDYHFTAGAGFGTIFQNNEWQNTERPIVTLSANTRLTRRFSLVSENWLFQLPFDHQIEKTDTLNGVISTYINAISSVFFLLLISIL
jgi:hypothetical protein